METALPILFVRLPTAGAGGVFANWASPSCDHSPTLSERYFGPMSESLSKTLAQWETPDVKVTKMPRHEAGFTRTNAAP
jgi:hypothetical protein